MKKSTLLLFLCLVIGGLLATSMRNTNTVDESFTILTTPEWWKVLSVTTTKDKSDVTKKFKEYFSSQMKFLAKDSTLVFKTPKQQYSAGHFTLSPDAQKLCLESLDTMKIITLTAERMELNVYLDKANPKDKKPALLVLRAAK